MAATSPPLVLLHGALGDVEQYTLLAAALDWSSDLLRVEFEGHGRTASPGRPFRIEHFAEHVLAATADDCGDGSARASGRR